MKCGEARRLFGSYWDDETTQVEREWLESHFTACSACREDYEAFSRSIELVGSLPRVEASPDLTERALQRARRATSAPDRLPTAVVPWVPATAAAALLLVLGSLISPWLWNRSASRGPVASAPREAELVHATPAVAHPPAHAGSGAGAADPLAVAPDNLFDHSADVEFILDPVTLHRGRAAVAHTPSPVQSDRSVITF